MTEKKVCLNIFFMSNWLRLEVTEEKAKEHISRWVRCVAGDEPHRVLEGGNGTWAYRTDAATAMTCTSIEKPSWDRSVDTMERMVKVMEQEVNRGEEWREE